MMGLGGLEKLLQTLVDEIKELRKQVGEVNQRLQAIEKNTKK